MTFLDVAPRLLLLLEAGKGLGFVAVTSIRPSTLDVLALAVGLQAAYLTGQADGDLPEPRPRPRVSAAATRSAAAYRH